MTMITTSNGNEREWTISFPKFGKRKEKMALYCPQGSGTLRQQLLMMHGIAWCYMVLHGIAWY